MFYSTRNSRVNASSFQIIKDSMLQADGLPLSEVVQSKKWQAAFDRHDVSFGNDAEAAYNQQAAEEHAGVVHPVVAEVQPEPLTGRILLVDGFMVAAADTAENQAECPQHPSQQEGLGFPLIRADSRCEFNFDGHRIVVRCRSGALCW